MYTAGASAAAAGVIIALGHFDVLALWRSITPLGAVR